MQLSQSELWLENVSEAKRFSLFKAAQVSLHQMSTTRKITVLIRLEMLQNSTVYTAAEKDENTVILMGNVLYNM